MRKIILASTSPRRKELLSRMGVTFSVVASNFDEQLDDARSPAEVAKELARGKAMAVAQRYPEAIVIGADNIVVVAGRQLGKPGSVAAARDMFKLTTSKPNEIYSGFSIVCLDERFDLTDAGKSIVYLQPYNEAHVEAYLRTGDYIDKAAGYAVQNPAAVSLIDHIEGDFDTIVGLPTRLVADALQKLGVPAHAANYSPPPGLRIQ